MEKMLSGGVFGILIAMMGHPDLPRRDAESPRRARGVRARVDEATERGGDQDECATEDVKDNWKINRPVWQRGYRGRQVTSRDRVGAIGVRAGAIRVWFCEVRGRSGAVREHVDAKRDHVDANADHVDVVGRSRG
jgi:hypothetical protein